LKVKLFKQAVSGYSLTSLVVVTSLLIMVIN